jgi:hypothetical protein
LGLCRVDTILVRFHPQQDSKPTWKCQDDDNT